jgi:hypothetical protein
MMQVRVKGKVTEKIYRPGKLSEMITGKKNKGLAK